ncbi:Oxysterol-binding protein-like protein [Glarea lozoyensis ATCC 20868]|uniref:Oxysterol-binding protein-like protein n=1 Tax=Glarea lozoyensis (strain ATCC 20868 / MF5171) TaxID=1116229 RepID=S3CXX0_GLAL2|nr:Oxysterol-binding protein-like protein [Glarea lozoyensis ATCC 20868]EPE30455.1 Oxysterol-binding protein-like protein [Glarea lozoyensis ATCC 20868]
MSSAHEKVSPNHKSALFSFLKSIASFKGDLSTLTAPPFLLAPQSVTEYSAYWAEHPILFVAAAKEEDPQKRALCVLKWFLSTLKEQHSNTDENGKKKRAMKPLNAFLGEQFLGKWVDEAGTTELVSEQVSHHPPVTAFNVWNNEHGVRLQGHIAPKVYFSGSVNIDRGGYGIMHIDEYNEDHLVTMPKVHVEGLVTGAPSPELSGTSYIRSSSGYTTKIEYSYKGWLGGKRNAFVATIFKDGKENEPIYTAEGTWSGAYTIKEVRTKRVLETFNIDTIPRSVLDVAPVEHQHPLESRRAWKNVIEGIKNADIFAIGSEKSKIEITQREMRKIEKAEGREFRRKYFTAAKRDPIAEKLAAGLKGTSMRYETDASRMIWLWDEAKYQRVQDNLRNGLKSPTHARFDSGISGMDLKGLSITASA